tara:strand:- start:820 stop:1284 length:465 start_codon:yes stop_codon:yes gene_type:complete
MPGFQLRARIERAPAAVWAVLADLEGGPRWMPGIASIALDEEGPLQPGSIYRFRVEGLKGSLQKGVVTALTPGRLLALSTTRGKVTAVYTYRLAADGGGTVITLEADCQVGGWLRPLAPLLVFLMQRSDGGQLEALKALLEDAEAEAGDAAKCL